MSKGLTIRPFAEIIPKKVSDDFSGPDAMLYISFQPLNPITLPEDRQS